MTDHNKLVKALRIRSGNLCPAYICDRCEAIHFLCSDKVMHDAAAAIEALQADVNFYKALAYLWQESTERKERLLGIYRALNMYSAKDPDGRLITNECFNMNRSESPNS